MTPVGTPAGGDDQTAAGEQAAPHWRTWLAGLPAWVWDVGLAASVAVAGILPSGHQPEWAYPLAFAAGAALVLRRRFPRLVVLATFPALIGQLGTIPAGAALYSLGRASTASPATRALLPWVVATMAATLLPVAYEDVSTGIGPATWGDWVVTVLVGLLITGGPAAAGALVSTRLELAASLRALQAAKADRDRAIAARVRAEERNRIARDVHDIVGHYASLIAVQASALEARAPDEGTRHTAVQVRELSSRALDEMRATLTDWDEQPEPAGG